MSKKLTGDQGSPLPDPPVDVVFYMKSGNTVKFRAASIEITRSTSGGKITAVSYTDPVPWTTCIDLDQVEAVSWEDVPPAKGLPVVVPA